MCLRNDQGFPAKKIKEYTNCKGPHTINEFKVSSKSELDILNGSFCNLCGLAVVLGLHIFATQCRRALTRTKTAVHCCDPALPVLVMLMSRNVFHVVSALQSIVFISQVEVIEYYTLFFVRMYFIRISRLKFAKF